MDLSTTIVLQRMDGVYPAFGGDESRSIILYEYAGWRKAPFGNVIYDSNPGFQPFGFVGGLY